MRLPFSFLLAALVLTAGSARAEGARDETSPSIALKDLPDGKPAAVSPKPRPRLNLEERKRHDEEDPEIMVLPKMEVTAPKAGDSPFEKRLEQLDQEEGREERSTHLSWLESLLNGKGFANVRVAQAKERVEVMRWERMLLVALLDAKTDDEREKIRDEIKMCKALRR